MEICFFIKKQFEQEENKWIFFPLLIREKNKLLEFLGIIFFVMFLEWSLRMFGKDGSRSRSSFPRFQDEEGNEEFEEEVRKEGLFLPLRKKNCFPFIKKEFLEKEEEENSGKELLKLWNLEKGFGKSDGGQKSLH